jgi:hypothetical protein
VSEPPYCPVCPENNESKPRVRSLRKLRKQPVLSRLTPPRESWRKRFSSSAQSKRVGKRGSGNTGVGYRQRVSRSSWTRRTGGRSRPIRQESGKSPPKKSTEDARKGDDGCRRGDKAPYVPDETCARCLLVLRALGGSLVGRMARRGVLLPIRNPGALWRFCWLRRRLVRGAASTGQRGLSPAPNRSRLC